MDQTLPELIEQRAREKAAKREIARIKREQQLSDLLAPYVARQPSQVILDNLQYKHDQWQGVTYAIIPPDKHQLHDLSLQLLDGASGDINLKLGMAFVNAREGDVYNKKTGRIVAAAKINDVHAKLTHFTANSKNLSYTIKAGRTTFEYILSHGKERPFLFAVYGTDITRRYKKMKRNR